MQHADIPTGASSCLCYQVPTTPFLMTKNSEVNRKLRYILLPPLLHVSSITLTTLLHCTNSINSSSSSYMRTVHIHVKLCLFAIGQCAAALLLDY